MGENGRCEQFPTLVESGSARARRSSGTRLLPGASGKSSSPHRRWWPHPSIVSRRAASRMPVAQGDCILLGQVAAGAWVAGEPSIVERGAEAFGGEAAAAGAALTEEIESEV